MTRMPFPVAVLVLLGFAAACGEDDAKTTAIPATTAASTTTAVPTRTQATARTAAPTPTTTTTTVPDDLHPVLGISGPEILPAAGATAEYLVTRTARMRAGRCLRCSSTASKPGSGTAPQTGW